MKWICSVCGYEHEGQSPPEVCPVCGVDADEFDLAPEPPADPTAASEPARQDDGPASPTPTLLCMSCENPLSTSPLPASCPMCGSRTALLSPAPDYPAVLKRPIGQRTYLIAGAGVAGWTAAEEIRANDPAATITLIGSESSVPYYRLSLTRYLAGDLRAPDLFPHPPSWFGEQRIDFLPETDLIEVDRGRHLAMTSRGPLPYDRLIAATGARPFVPPLKNLGVRGVRCLRTVHDAQALLSSVRPQTRVVVIGGGILGLETGFALSRRGCQVTVCEGASHLLNRQLDPAAASLLQHHLEGKGLSFALGDLPTEIIGDESVRKVRLTSGAAVDADLVVLSAGIRPNTLIWQRAGLEVEKGLVVNDTLQTSDREVFAAGDVAEHRGVLYGIWPVALEMGRLAGCNAAGRSDAFSGQAMSHTLKVVDLDVFSIGITDRVDPDMTQVVQNVEPPGYAKLVFKRGVLVGAILMRNTSMSTRLRALIQQRRDLSAVVNTARSPQEVFFQLGESTVG